jgi:hypothetical protein
MAVVSILRLTARVGKIAHPALWGAILLGGCSKPPPAPAPAREVVEPSVPGEPLEIRAEPTPVRQSTAPDVVISTLPRTGDMPGANLPEQPAALEALYGAASTGVERREAIIRQLGRMDTGESGAALARIFGREKRLELRMAVLEVVADFTSDATQALRFEIFARAVGPAQPVIVRLNALQTLAGFDDPRARDLLGALADDPDTEIRSMAREVLQSSP